MFFIYLLACLAIYVPTTINGRRYLRFGDTFNGKKNRRYKCGYNVCSMFRIEYKTNI